ncbi:hypothetical protein [Acinetobacter chinensis]|uniref:hypothetical protein n=1 Tax=Acinetobacter chinensis TaxID=2004650 RepID=UPI0029344B36|nr:hypothetical protein [Acinetobacter chinensis]WOE40051.1 hypothetical protein QSG87_09005 [Acinetobacter chinensis]
MNITSELHEEVGIQKRKIIDRTEVQTVQSITDATIVGQFRRGVLGEMIIHQGNIRGELGYDPTNPDYIAVQSCLDAGIPSVKVIRVGNMGVECNPVGWSLNRSGLFVFTASNYKFAYSINGSAKIQGGFERTAGHNHSAGDILRAILEIIDEENSSLSLFIDGSGGTAYFQIGSSTLSLDPAYPEDVLSEGEEISPVTIKIYSVAGQEQDPINMIFKSDMIELHSCGLKYWDGY